MSRYFRHSTADYKNELDIPKPPVLQYSKLFQSTKKFKENGLYSPRTQLGIHRPEVKVCAGKHSGRIHSFYFRLIFKKFVPGHSPFFFIFGSWFTTGSHRNIQRSISDVSVPVSAYIWSVDPLKSHINDFYHSSDFDFTFDDVMNFDLQNIHEDFPTQIHPLIHHDFDNMR